MSKLFHWSVQDDEVKEVVIRKDIVQLRRRLWRLAEEEVLKGKEKIPPVLEIGKEMRRPVLREGLKEGA